MKINGQNRKDGVAKLPIAVLFGGRGSERQVSMRSAENFLDAMERRRIPYIKVGIKADGAWFLYSGDNSGIGSGAWEGDSLGHLLSRVHPVSCAGRGALAMEKEDRGPQIIPISGVIPLIHGVGGEDGSIAGLLESLGIPYIGCDPSASSLAFDKSYCKIIAESAGIPTVPFVTLIKGGTLACGSWCSSYEEARLRAERDFGYPMFVKPSREGSSFGAGIASCGEELYTAVERALSYGDRVIIEKYLSDVTELECAYLSRGECTIITSPGTVRHGRAFYDLEGKYNSSGHTRIYPRAEVPDSVSSLIKEYTSRIVSVIGIRDLSRIDYFLDGSGRAYLNEINTIPGLTKDSLYPAMLEAFGVSWGDLAECFAELLMERGL